MPVLESCPVQEGHTVSVLNQSRVVDGRLELYVNVDICEGKEQPPPSPLHYQKKEKNSDIMSGLGLKLGHINLLPERLDANLCINS